MLMDGQTTVDRASVHDTHCDKKLILLINFIEEVELIMEEHGLKYLGQVFTEIRKDSPMSARKYTHQYN